MRMIIFGRRKEEQRQFYKDLYQMRRENRILEHEIRQIGGLI